MTTRADRLLADIEVGALDARTSIGDLLRKVVALGGQSGSAELRDWAARELKGYGPGDELPEYRKIAAPLHVDMMNMRWIVKGQSISPMELPEFARDRITNDVDLRMGIAEIEQYVRQCPPDEVVKLQPHSAQELVVIINAENRLNGHLERLYWGISPVALDGVVDQVRTALTVMVAEIRANMPDRALIPTAEVATNAVTIAVTGKRNQVNLASSQGGSSVAPATLDEAPRHQWVRVAAGVILGLITIVGVFFALMQAQGWQFG